MSAELIDGKKIALDIESGFNSGIAYTAFLQSS